MEGWQKVDARKCLQACFGDDLGALTVTYVVVIIV